MTDASVVFVTRKSPSGPKARPVGEVSPAGRASVSTGSPPGAMAKIRLSSESATWKSVPSNTIATGEKLPKARVENEPKIVPSGLIRVTESSLAFVTRKSPSGPKARPTGEVSPAGRA